MPDRANLHPLRRSNGAFGIIELLLVLACFGILVGMAVPALSRYREDWALLNGVRMLELSLHWGRYKAISVNTPVALTVESGGGRYCCTDAATGERFEYSIHDFPDGVRITAAPQSPVRFHPQGNAAPAGTFIVTGRHAAYRVVVNLRGRIRTQRI